MDPISLDFVSWENMFVCIQAGHLYRDRIKQGGVVASNDVDT